MLRLRTICTLTAVGFCSLLVDPVLAEATLKESTKLSYDYSVPYTGGATLTLYNDGDQPVTLTELRFTTNTVLNGNPYGQLWGWQSTVTKEQDADGINYNYVIIENPSVTIAAHQSSILNYAVNINLSGGPLKPYNIAMSPAAVQVKLQNANAFTTVPINGICTVCKDPGFGKRILGYFPDWAYWRQPKFTADGIPYRNINTVAYAFSIFDRNGNVSLYDQDSDAVNIPIIAAARQRYSYLNASLSFGGWSWFSTPPGWECQKGESPQGPAACFSQMAADPAAVNAFVKNAVKAMKTVQFNGIDIDWEYPETKDADHYVNLLVELRKALDAEGQKDQTKYFLTIASAAGVDKIQRLSKAQWQTVQQAVDYIGVMTYDFHGGWDQYSDFMSAMALDLERDPYAKTQPSNQYNITDGMQAYLDLGVPSEKLLLGIPAYGRMVNITSAGTKDGLYQPIIGLPLGEWDNTGSGATGMIDYRCIVDATTCGNNYQLPKLTLASFAENPLGKYALTPWGYNQTTFITYDDQFSTALKTKWAKDKNFAGIMLWDLTGDFPPQDPRSLIGTINRAFQ